MKVLILIKCGGWNLTISDLSLIHIFNVAHAGKFTSDRTIQEYVDDIWKLDKMTVEFPEEAKLITTDSSVYAGTSFHTMGRGAFCMKNFYITVYITGIDQIPTVFGCLYICLLYTSRCV